MFNIECGVVNRIWRRNLISFDDFLMVLVLWTVPHHAPIKHRHPIKKSNWITPRIPYVMDCCGERIKLGCWTCQRFWVPLFYSQYSIKSSAESSLYRNLRLYPSFYTCIVCFKSGKGIIVDTWKSTAAKLYCQGRDQIHYKFWYGHLGWSKISFGLAVTQSRRITRVSDCLSLLMLTWSLC